jgi:hypothetical protein
VVAILHPVASPQLLAGLAVLAGLVTATWLRAAAPGRSPDAFAWPMAASLFCAPVVFPWYLLWLLPFLGSARTLPIIVWTVSIIPTYVVWHLRTLGLGWGPFPGWIMPLEYGCVAMAGAMIALRRLVRPATPRYSNGLVQSGLSGQHNTSVSGSPGGASNTTSVQFTKEGRS